jgi:hypothetical protein
MPQEMYDGMEEAPEEEFAKGLAQVTGMAAAMRSGDFAAAADAANNM